MESSLIRFVPAVVLVVVVACAAREMPSGFGAWGTRVPPAADAIPIPDGFTEQLPEFEHTAPSWTAAEVERGYVTFATSYMQLVYPRTKPTRERITTGLKAFCSRGEYEPVTFAIHALRALTAVQVTVGDLTSAAGDVIPAARIDVRSVRCWPKRVWKNPPVAQYMMTPWVLEKRDALDVPEARTQQFWLTVHVPPDAAGGVYHATVRVQAGGAETTSLALELEVLPIVLRAPPTRHGMYYHMVDETRPAPHPPLSDDYLAKEIVNMREHGMNSVFVMLYPSIAGTLDAGKVSYDLTPIAFFVRTCLEVGLGPGSWNTTVDDLLPKYKGPSSLGSNVRGFVESFHARGWPTPIVSFGDESDAHDAWSTAASLGAIKAAVPEALTYTTIVYPKNSEAYEPHLDIRAFSSYLDRDGAERTRKAGRQLWMYSGPSEGNVKANRFYRGLWASALGLDGVVDWVYFTFYQRDHLYNDLVDPRGGPNHRGWVVPAPDGPLPTVSWEGTREGIDDGRYLFTLQSLIAEARTRTDAKLAAAAQRGDDAVRALHATVDARDFGDRYPLWRTCDAMSVASFDDFRYRVAQHILELQALLEQGAVPEASP